jgi:tetratricopeptide (TPR) repeat protein
VGALRRLAAAAGVLGVLASVAGCGGAPVYRSAPLEREQELNRKATAAYERGKYESALALSREALQISRAIEHADGIAANLLNLAAVQRALGERAQAAQAVDELLAAGPIAFSPERRSAAAYLRALLELDAGAFPEAARLAAAARELCRTARCGSEGRIVNLQARAAFLGGDPARALTLAREALALNREAGADEETANALRTMADAALVSGGGAEAEAGYAAALALDKKLGLAAKIRLDLLRLGDAAAAAGRIDAARDYFRRALGVSRGAADEAGAAEAEARLRGLEGSR